MARAFAPAPAVGAVAAPLVGPGVPPGYPRRPLRKKKITAVGVDNATPWLIITYLVANLALLIYLLVALPRGGGPFAWTFVVTNVVSYFAIIGPAVLLAVWLGAKVLNFELQDAAYLRCCGIGAIPGVMLALGIMMLVVSHNVVAFTVLILASVPLFLYVIKFSFDLNWAEATVSFGFGILFYGVAQTASILFVVMVAAGSIPRHGITDPDNIVENPDSQAPVPHDHSSSAQPSPPIVPTDPDQVRLQHLRERIVALTNRPTDGQSREAMLADLGNLKAEAEGMKARAQAKPAWADIPGLLAVAEQKFAALPSEKPDAAIFEPVPAGPSWQVAAGESTELAPEVSFRQYKLRPPADALLDLRSSETDANGLVWRHRKTGGAELSIKLIPRRNPRQLRPWVATESFMLRTADAKSLLAVDAPNATTEYGQIDGLPFTHIASGPSAAKFAERWVKYVALVGNDWLVLDIRCPQDEGQLAQTFERAARSVRKAAAGEARAEPFAAERIAPRLADDPDRAADILRRLGSSAEAAVAAQLDPSVQSSLWARRKAAQVLAEIATEKSAAALKQAALSDDEQTATAARRALKRVVPNQFDQVSEAILDLKADRYPRRQAALETLAASTPDPARRAEVAGLLEDMIVGDKAGFEIDAAAKALAVWYTDKTAPRMLPLLDKQKTWDARKRHAAMTVLAATKDKHAVMPIMVPWLVEDTDHAVSALIAIGPPAEEEMVRVKVLWDPSAKGRKAAAQVLEQIGTARCLPDLQRASKDPRDAAAAAAAQQALEAVKARAAAARPASGQGTGPATKPAG